MEKQVTHIFFWLNCFLFCSYVASKKKMKMKISKSIQSKSLKFGQHMGVGE